MFCCFYVLLEVLTPWCSPLKHSSGPFSPSDGSLRNLTRGDLCTPRREKAQRRLSMGGKAQNHARVHHLNELEHCMVMKGQNDMHQHVSQKRPGVGKAIRKEA